MEILKADVKTLSRTSSWRTSIVKFLKTNNGANDIEIYDATRPDRMNISESKKRHNIASQLTYLRNDDYLVIKEDKSVFLLAEPNLKKKGSLTVIKE